MFGIKYKFGFFFSIDSIDTTGGEKGKKSEAEKGGEIERGGEKNAQYKNYCNNILKITQPKII